MRRGDDPDVLTLLALLIAAPSVPGCRYVGSALHCELDAPVRPLLPAAKSPPPAKTAPARHYTSYRRHRSHSESRETQEASRSAPAAAPSDADIQSHIESLAVIGDCSGVKAYTTAVRSAAAADAAWRACLGQPASTTPGLPPAPTWIGPPGKAPTPASSGFPAAVTAANPPSCRPSTISATNMSSSTPTIATGC
jgi:hypothetical protein